MAMRKARKHELAEALIDLLARHELFEEVQIFVNGGRLGSWPSDKHPGTENRVTKHGKIPYKFTENYPYNETYANPDLLTFTFEGLLYDVINQDLMPSVREEMDELFKKYGVYMEQSYAWSAAVYYI